MRKKAMLWAFITILLLLGVVYLLGPHPAVPVYSRILPTVPSAADALEANIQTTEAALPVKPNNEARIVWYNDSMKQKTAFAMVYLHGFSASQQEGAPVHTNIAKEFGCNLYLSRLAEHGLAAADPMKNLTPSVYWESALRALAIGKQIGNKVILMGTSTGASLALQLAATFPQEVAALVLMSPNIALFNDKAWLLNNHWGLQIAQWITGSRYVTSADNRPAYRQYWYGKYPLEAAVQLQEYLETAMTQETFRKVSQPVLMLYYYKDEVHQDSVVSVPAMLKMFDELGTAKTGKVKQALPNAGNHVLGSYIKSKDLLGVQREIENFLIKKLHLNSLPGAGITTVTADTQKPVTTTAP